MFANICTTFNMRASLLWLWRHESSTLIWLGLAAAYAVYALYTYAAPPCGHLVAHVSRPTWCALKLQSKYKRNMTSRWQPSSCKSMMLVPSSISNRLFHPVQNAFFDLIIRSLAYIHYTVYRYERTDEMFKSEYVNGERIIMGFCLKAW